MDIVNNRYRIVKKLNTHIANNIEEFLALDLWSHEEEISLKVISAKAISEEVFYFIKDGFIVISSFDGTYYLKDYGFACLNLPLSNSFLIDSDEKFYIFTSEYISNGIPLLVFAQSCSIKDILEITINLCRALTYINNVGISYTSLKPCDIFIVKTKTGFNVKIKDIVTKKLEDPFSVYFSEADSPFWTDGALKIFGEIIISILAGREIQNNFLAAINEIKRNYKGKLNKEDALILNCLCSIAKKAVSFKPGSKKLKVCMLLQDINQKLNTDYMINTIPPMRCLTLRPRMVGKQNYIKSLLQSFKEINSGYSGKNIFIVKGPLGTGKTRFLKEIFFELSLEYANIYFNHRIKTYGCEYFWEDFLEKVFLNFHSKQQNNATKDAILKTVQDLRILKTQNGNTYNYEHLKFKLFNEATDLFFKLVSNSSGFIIIDDLHLADDFILEVFLYLTMEITKVKKLGIIFSYDEMVQPLSMKFEAFLKILKLSKNVEHFNLENFSVDETIAVLKNILLLKYYPREVGKVLYRQTQGSPLFIVEIIKELVALQFLYIDKETGMWYVSINLKNEDISDKISRNIGESLRNQVNAVSPVEKKAIFIMVLFQNTFRKEYLYALLPFSASTIDKIIDSLLNKSIISKIYNCNEVEYAMSNRMLKNILYNDMTFEFKTENHKKISKILQKYDVLNKNELIWHLEQSGDNKTTVKYYMENVEKNLKSKKLNEAILNCEKILTLIKNDEERCRILLKIADFNYQLGAINKELQVLNSLSEIISKINNDEILSLYYYQWANYAYINEDAAKVFPYMEKQAKLYEKCKSIEICVNLHATKCMYHKLTQNIEKLQIEADEILKLADTNEKYLPYKCDALICYGYINYINKKYKRALKNYKESRKLSIQCHYIKCEIVATYNISTIYSFIDTDIKKSLRYMRMLIRKCRQLDLFSLEILTLLNYSITLSEIHNNEAAYKYAQEAYLKAEENDIIAFKFTRIANLINITRTLNKYNEMFKYQRKAQKILQKATGENIENILEFKYVYYYLLADIYQDLCYNKLSYYFLKRMIKLKEYRKTESLALMYFRIEAMRIILKKKSNIDTLIKYLDSYIHHINVYLHSYRIKIIPRTLIDSMLILTIERPDIDFSKLIVKLLETQNFSSKNFQQAILYYFESIIDKKNEEVLLAKALQIAKHKGNIFFNIVLNIKLGLFYKDSGQDVPAIMNFLEAQSKIALMFKNIPRKYHIHIYNNSFYHIAFDYVREFLNGKNISKLKLSKPNVAADELYKILNLSHIKIIRKNVEFKHDLLSLLLRENGFDNMSYSDMFKIDNADFLMREKKIIQFLSLNLIAPQYGLFILNQHNELSISVISSSFSDDIKTLYELIIKFGYDRIADVQKMFNKPCMIIPIERKNGNSFFSLLGFMVFVSESIINNFSKEGKQLCKNYVNLLAMMIESNNFRQAASFDVLTGALTRKNLEIALKNILKKSSKAQTKFSILLYDLDKFKNVNDTYGHHIGDKVLKAIADAIFENLNQDQKLGRYGGEEFVIILPQIDKNAAFDYAEKFRKKIETIHFEEKNLEITISLGIACYPDDGETITDLILKADQALYNAKNTGRNKSCLWSYGLAKKQKFAGIVGGGHLVSNEAVYSEVIFAAIELVEISKMKQQRKKMFSDFLFKLTRIFNSENCAIILSIKNAKTSIPKFHIAAKLGFDVYKINKDLTNSVLNGDAEICQIDWDNIAGKNIITHIPEWNSIMITPLIKNGTIVGAVYLATPEKKHEFNSDNLSLLRFFADIISANI